MFLSKSLSLDLIDKLDSVLHDSFDEIYRVYVEDKNHYDDLLDPHDSICSLLSDVVYLREKLSHQRKEIEDSDFRDLNQHIQIMRKKYQMIEDEFVYTEEDIEDDSAF